MGRVPILRAQAGSRRARSAQALLALLLACLLAGWLRVGWPQPRSSLSKGASSLAKRAAQHPQRPSRAEVPAASSLDQSSLCPPYHRHQKLGAHHESVEIVVEPVHDPEPAGREYSGGWACSTLLRLASPPLPPHRCSCPNQARPLLRLVRSRLKHLRSPPAHISSASAEAPQPCMLWPYMNGARLAPFPPARTT